MVTTKLIPINVDVLRELPDIRSAVMRTHLELILHAALHLADRLCAVGLSVFRICVLLLPSIQSPPLQVCILQVNRLHHASHLQLCHSWLRRIYHSQTTH